MTDPTNKLGAEMQDEQIEAVANALRRAWQLGQTYRQQADSESWKQQDKSGETRMKFESLMDETRRLLARQPAAIDKQCTCKGVLGHSRQCAMFDESMMSIAAPLANEANKPAVVQGCDIDFSGVMGIPPKHDALDVCPKCSCRRGSGSQCSNKPCPFDRASPAAPSVEQDERVAFRDTLRAALKSYRRANPSRYLNDDQVDASDSEFVSDLMAYVPVGEKPRAASTSANVARYTPPQFASPTDAQIIEVLKTIDGWAMEHGLCDSTFPKAVAKVRELFSANVAQGAETVGYYLEYGSGRYDVIPAWATADKNQALLVEQRGSPVYRVAPPAQPALTDDARDAFIRDVAAQKPEKPDHWSSCGQCGHNIERAQDLLDAAQSAIEDTK